MLKIILFIHSDSGDSGKLFKQAIDRIAIVSTVNLFQDFNSFKIHLITPVDFKNKEIFILFADSEARLNKLSVFIDLLEGKRLLLVAPDRKPETTSKILKFLPRFFTYINDDYDDLCAVIKKIIIMEEENGK